MTGFIIYAIDTKGNKYYVSNTSPILWTGEVKESKVFDSYITTRHELEDNYTSLSNTIKYSDICIVFISEYMKDIEIGRDKFYEKG